MIDDLPEQLINLRWGVVLRTGLFVVALSHALVFAVVGLYAIGVTAVAVMQNIDVILTPETASDEGEPPPYPGPDLTPLTLPDLDPGLLFADIGNWALPAMTILVTVVGAARVSRQVEVTPQLHGVMVGVTAAVGTAILGGLFEVIFPGGIMRGFLVFILIVMAGWASSTPVHADLTKAAALSAASRAIRSATDLTEVVTALGENLAGPDITAVYLWQVMYQEEAETPTEFVLLAGWTPPGQFSWPTGVRFNTLTDVPTLTQYKGLEPLLLAVNDMPTTEQPLWRQLEARSLALIPLTGGVTTASEEGTDAGMILVASRSVWGLREEILGTYLMVDAQVALMIENLRLMHKARHTGVLQERQRLAHEIHDTLAQSFTSIVMHLEAAEQALPLPDKLRTVWRHLDLARHMAREGLGQARRLVWALRPQPLESMPLPEAIARVVRRWSGQSGIKAQAQATGDPIALHPDAEVTLLRATQEALANIQKHAQAELVTVTLSYMDDMVMLDVQDDGVGFDSEQIKKRPASESSGFGLQGMQTRLDEFGGQVLLESEPGEGTTIVISIPLRDNLE